MRTARSVFPRIVVAACLMTMAGCQSLPWPKPLAPEGQVHGFHVIEATPAGWDTQRHTLYVPLSYTPDNEWPMIVFLHGYGDQGHDGRKPTRIALASAIEKHPERFPALVLFPQAPPGAVFGDREERWHFKTKDASPLITAAMDYVIDNYTVDEDRVTLTGISMGGFGTYYYGAQHAETFAALMPIAGGGRIVDAPVLATIPLWIFHGAKDRIIDVAQAAVIVSEIQKAGGNPRLTVFPDEGHWTWDQVYYDPEAMAWLLAQRRTTR